jgi:glucosylceramidase
MLQFLLLFVVKIHCDYLIPWQSGDGVGKYFQVGDKVGFGDTKADVVFELFPETTYQEIIGIGAALTESAGSNFIALSADKQEELAKLFFDAEQGIGTTLARTHICSADFSISEYIYTTDEDPNLGTFNIDRDRKFFFQFFIFISI